MKLGDVGIRQGRRDPLSGVESADAFLAAGHPQQIAVGRPVPMPVETLTGEGMIEGAAVQLLAREGIYAQLRLRSGEIRKVHVDCRATGPTFNQKRGPSMAAYGNKASEKVEKAMHERKQGTLKSGRSGKTVKSRKQAIAIGLSEARKAGGARKTAHRSSSKRSS